MVVSRQVLTRWTKLETSIEFKRFLTKVPCATCFGLTQMRRPDGVFLRAVLVTHSDRTLQNSFYNAMA